MLSERLRATLNWGHVRPGETDAVLACAGVPLEGNRVESAG